MVLIYENSEFILRTTVRSEICPFGLNKSKPRIAKSYAEALGIPEIRLVNL